MEECPKLKSTVSSKENNPGGSSNADIDEDYSSHLFCQPHKVSFGSLQKLFTDQNPCCGHEIPVSIFKGLEELEIFEYEGDMSLFTSSIAQNFVILRILSIGKCDKMVHVFQDEEEKTVSGGQETTPFPNLQKLELRDLRKLKRFCKWKCDIELPSLSQVIIVKCPMMTNFTLKQPLSAIAQLQILHIEECEMMEQVFLWNEKDNQRNIDTTLAFSELTSLSLKYLPKLTSLCEGIESFEFPKLTQIQVKDCPVLVDKVFSINLFLEPDKVKMEIWNNQPFRNAEYLSLEGNAYRNLDVREVQNMRWLTLRECSWGTKLVNVTTMDTLFPQLEVLRLLKLPELEEIWEIDGPIKSNSFKNLKELRLEFLPALKHLWQSNSSSSQMNVVSIFSKLSSLYIYGCHQLYSLFSLPVTETDSCLLQLEELVIKSCDRMEHLFFWNEGENKSNIHIPKLKVLILDSLPKLTCFCRGIENFEFPSLDQKRISRCPLLGNFVSTDNHHDDYIDLFCKLDDKDQEKMELKLQGNITLGRNKIQECVEYMSFEGDGSTSSDFGVENLVIESCKMMEQVFLWNEEESQRSIVFPKLKVLKLDSLPKLMSFCQGTKSFKLPLLVEMRISRCPLQNLVSTDDSLIDHDHDSIHLFCKADKVSFGSLKVLSTTRNPFCGHKISASSFKGLVELRIIEYQSGMSLFSSSIARNLLSLRVLDISKCNEMVQVIQDEEEEEEKVVSASDQSTLLFPKLKNLELRDLRKLEAFCEWNSDVELPSLLQVVIVRCPKMTNFSSGQCQLAIMGKDCISKLEILNIEECEMMEEVYLWNEEDKQRNIDTTLVFSKLKSISLKSLPRFSSLCKGIESFEFPQLTQIQVKDCPILLQNVVSINLFSKSNKVKMEKLMKNQPFIKLSSLHVYGCHELCNLFSMTEMDSCRLQLKELVIESCDRMEHVFFLNEGENQSNIIHIPNLKVLILDSLPKLTCFCKGIESFEFPPLDQKRISRCPLLKNLVSTDWSPEDYIRLFCKPENKVQEKMELKLQGNITLERNKIQECVEYMSFEGDGSTSSDFGVELRNICKGIERIQCPLLDKMKIINCPQLESLVYRDKKSTFIFNSSRSAQLHRGKGANTALQPQEKQQQQQEVEEEQSEWRSSILISVVVITVVSTITKQTNTAVKLRFM
ncbi:hypothetical protein C2S51_003272 [Perilla frutescens var. frutescens]|nr:hypothetical protein C2S51_003272 [Perilla frutescens var. frutescens]